MDYQPKKKGADWIPVSTDLSSDERVVYLVSRLGHLGRSLYMQTLEFLGRQHDFRIDLSGSAKTMVCVKFCCSEDELDSFLATALFAGLLSQDTDGRYYSKDLDKSLQRLVERRKTEAERINVKRKAVASTKKDVAPTKNGVAPTPVHSKSESESREIEHPQKNIIKNINIHQEPPSVCKGENQKNTHWGGFSDFSNSGSTESTGGSQNQRPAEQPKGNPPRVPGGPPPGRPHEMDVVVRLTGMGMVLKNAQQEAKEFINYNDGLGWKLHWHNALAKWVTQMQNRSKKHEDKWGAYEQMTTHQKMDHWRKFYEKRYAQPATA